MRRADRRVAGPGAGHPRGNGSPLGVPGAHLRSGAVSPVRRVTGSTVPSLFPVSVPTRGGAARKQPRVAPPGRVTYCRCVVGPHPGVCDRSAGDSSPVTPYAAGAGDARDRPHRNVLGRRPAPSSAVSSPARTGQECPSAVVPPRPAPGPPSAPPPPRPRPSARPIPSRRGRPRARNRCRSPSRRAYPPLPRPGRRWLTPRTGSRPGPGPRSAGWTGLRRRRRPR